MTLIQDLRGHMAMREANGHIKNLEELVKACNPSIFKKTVSQLGSFSAATGAGYLAGYAFSGGKTDAAIYIAEYAALAWAGWKLMFDAQIAIAHFFYSNAIKKHLAKIKSKITKEYIQQKKIERNPKLGVYTPKYGVNFTNSPFNSRTVFENQQKTAYYKNIETSRKPIRSAAMAMAGSSLAFFFGTFAADVGSNMMEYVTGLNPLELGINAVHCATKNIQMLAGYTPTIEYCYCGDFPQLPMLMTGATLGLIKTAKEFLVGSYYRAKALLKIS